MEEDLPLEVVVLACVQEEGAWLQMVLQEVASCSLEHQGVGACASEVETFAAAAVEGWVVVACPS